MCERGEISTIRTQNVKERPMKMISKETINDKTIITTETNGWFRKKIRKFEAQEESPKGYWKWLELPDHLLVDGVLSFQLDAWNKLAN